MTMTTGALFSLFRYLAELAPQGGTVTLICAMCIAGLSYCWFMRIRATDDSTLPPRRKANAKPGRALLQTTRKKNDSGITSMERER